MDTDDHSGASLSSGIGRDCANCGTRLATDQRYCVSCGTRRGPLPAAVDSTLREMGVPPAPVIEKLAPPPERRSPLTLSLPTPRVASLAVLATLAFGVVAGSLTQPGGVESLARNIVVNLPFTSPTTPPTPTVAANSGGGGGDGGGGGAQQVITETITQPAAGGGAAGAATCPRPQLTPAEAGAAAGVTGRPR